LSGTFPTAVFDASDDGERLKWERDCLARARRGDRAAFAELYDAFAGELFRRVLMPRLGNRQAAEDALAETFRTLLERLDDYEDQGKSVWHWLCRIAINKATDMHRVKGRTSRALANFEGLLKPLAIGPSDPGAELAMRIESEHVKQAVADVLERLNPRYRRAIELRFLEDRSREQCAEMLEVKIGTFDVLLLRALRSFRKEWDTVISERKSQP
jgi:RNA polymerase sigma-70 factor (ECF subfamily)